MLRKSRIGKKPGVVLAELMLVTMLALALGRDVSQAAGQCNTKFDCSLDCVNQQLGGSEEKIETATRYTTGSSSGVCGTWYLYSQSACNGSSSSGTLQCAGNCCP
jgi:hypothetical protein